MYGTGIIVLFFLVLTRSEVTSNALLQVRLSGGTSPHQGRLEVFNNGEWGTVCDDKFSKDVCNVICKQLGYGSEGVCINELGDKGCIKNDASVFGLSTARILFDEVRCEGHESTIDGCSLKWSKSHFCGHKEDAGCICNSVKKNSCDKSRHRIAPLDRSNPIMGRVEIQDDSRNWGLVCDDEWDDVDASVFCDCLGFKDRRFFRALLFPNHTSSLPMLFYAVHCKPQDLVSTKNLWECPVVKADKGQCNPNVEAAGVICGSPSTRVPLVIPTVDLYCFGHWLLGCFEKESNVYSEHFSIHPICTNAMITKFDNGTVCVRINMDLCLASHMKIRAYAKHYCYDITFSRIGIHAVHLLTKYSWSRRLCCIRADSRTTVGSSLLHIVGPPALWKERISDSEIRCYLSWALQVALYCGTEWLKTKSSSFFKRPETDFDIAGAQIVLVLLLCVSAFLLYNLPQILTVMFFYQLSLLVFHLFVYMHKDSNSTDNSSRPQPAPQRGFVSRQLRVDYIDRDSWSNNCVYGIARVKNYLYCLFKNSVGIFEIDKKASVKVIVIADLQNEGDIAVCPITNCIYFLDYFKGIWTLTSFPFPHLVISTDYQLKSWMLRPNQSTPLSITREGNLVLIVDEMPASRLEVFDMNAVLLYAVPLPDFISEPRHVQATATGQFVISCGSTESTVHGVVKVEKNGQIMSRFDPQYRWQNLRNPVYTAIDLEGRIFIADEWNNRIVQLNNQLNIEQIVYSHGQDGFQNPFRIIIDEEMKEFIVLHGHNVSGIEHIGTLMDFFNFKVFVRTA